MLRLDNRTGSKELLRYFSPYGIVPKLAKLEFGDLDWPGWNEQGQCAIGAERKTIDDLVQSIQLKRLPGHQIKGMADAFDVRYLLVEGLWRPGPEGELQVHRGRDREGKPRWVSTGMHAEALVNHVMSLLFTAGAVPWRTANPEETVAFVVYQYHWWQKKWHEHQSHDVFYGGKQEGSGGRMGFNFRPRKVSQCEKFVQQIPGMEWKSRFVARHFRSGRRMMLASVNDWVGLDWKTKDGKKTMKISREEARRIAEVLEKED